MAREFRRQYPQPALKLIGSSTTTSSVMMKPDDNDDNDANDNNDDNSDDNFDDAGRLKNRDRLDEIDGMRAAPRKRS
jgi:hypothetical protein